MTKLKLNISLGLGEVLTKEELKRVFGGTGSGSGSGSGSDECATTSHTLGCSGLNENDACYYCNIEKKVKSGHCKFFPFSGLQCWGG